MFARVLIRGVIPFKRTILVVRGTNRAPFNKRNIMARYRMEFMTRQTAVKHVVIDIDGLDEADAEARAREALREYPAAIMQTGVHRIQTKRSEYSEPDAVELMSVREDRRFA